MRNLLLVSLLATTMATPALAQDRGMRGDRGEQASSSSQEPGSRRAERAERRRSDDGPSQSQPRSRSDDNRPVMRERPAESNRQGGGFDRRGNRDGATTSNAGDTVRNWRGRDRRPDSPTEIQDRNLGTAPAVVDNRTIEERNLRRPMDREVRTNPGFGGRRAGRIGNNVPVEGTAPPPVTTEMARRGNDNHRRWSGDWRRDGRYDWRRYRDRNRSRFHLGFYFDPFGWNYRRHSIGWRLWPSYYGQDYWLNDPWQYRLPPAYGPYRWVRYYDDALLVNIYTGTVVDVIHNFFW
ncbi:MAG TPA: RcnB family protein [Sphingomicrobium sp.]